jgi:glycogen debranching enzyme
MMGMEPTLYRIASTASLHKALPLPALALATVISRDGQSVYASSDTMFKGAVFGRDSLEVADDLIAIKPALAHNILLTLASLQGMEEKTDNEEQRGKIIHEYRTSTLNGRPLDEDSKRIYDELSGKWGGNKGELAYYGSIDSTPHFLRTLWRYTTRYGEDILDEDVMRRDGILVHMRQAARDAVRWLEREMARSESGMLEYRKRNPLGKTNQAWKDSEEAYVHENGEIANHRMPVASIEVQGLAYEAFMAAASFFPDDEEEYQDAARKIRDVTINTLWLPKREYFALGTDYDSEGNLRAITTPMANAAALLDTGIFDGLPIKERQQYISAIVRRVFDKDFLTSAGIRSRSLEKARLVSFWDYHGSYASWPKETYDIAKGLRRQGFPRLSRQLENRLLNLVLKTREYPEFVYVDGWGRVLTGKPQQEEHSKGIVTVAGHDTPERIQAWTVSALMAILTGRGLARIPLKKRRQIPSQESWQQSLEEEILARIPHVDAHLNPVKLWLNYPTYKYRLTGSKNTRAV